MDDFSGSFVNLHKRSWYDAYYSKCIYAISDGLSYGYMLKIKSIFFLEYVKMAWFLILKPIQSRNLRLQPGKFSGIYKVCILMQLAVI